MAILGVLIRKRLVTGFSFGAVRKQRLGQMRANAGVGEKLFLPPYLSAGHSGFYGNSFYYNHLHGR